MFVSIFHLFFIPYIYMFFPKIYIKTVTLDTILSKFCCEEKVYIRIVWLLFIKCVD
ncbi:hypothetical protein Lalb_Chr19g0135081 [Lupinus albus]|uniref:Uncharacterized protein n=1 Tax=Lupinus albus TaxID=3870 RepID=A0A6A4NH31_LUPAL|nr:hypothetical protein Lalb_Chr19g0135081 [Lupinus albus]